MKTQTGDLIAITRGIVCHQVNCVGATGGLASALRRKWPLAFDAYFARCKVGSRALGTCVFGEAAPDLYIAHIFGQLQPGPHTDLQSVNLALISCATQIAHTSQRELPIYVPYLMGCGLGGGRWDQYLPLLEKHFPSATIIQLPA